MDQTCKTCKYESTPFGHTPCVLCKRSDGMEGIILSNWEPKEKEEKKMVETKKTKAQLQEELERKNAEIKALKEELNKTEQYDIYLAGAKEVRGMVDAYIEAGFTEEQAFELIKMFLSNSQPIVPSGKSRYEFRR